MASEVVAGWLAGGADQRRGRIVIAAADGSARNDLGPGDAPAWSPDGTLIACAGASAGLDYTTRDVHLVRSDGSGNESG